MRVGLIAIFLAIWFLNSPVLQRIYNVKDYYGYVAFVNTRFQVYEFMFLSLSVVCFIACTGLSRALASFAIIMIAGSLVDKVIFKVSGYMIGDIVLIFLGIIASYFVWKRTSLRT